MSLEFAFGRLGLTSAQTSGLAQVGFGALIDESGIAIDSTRAGTSDSPHVAATGRVKDTLLSTI